MEGDVIRPSSEGSRSKQPASKRATKFKNKAVQLTTLTSLAFVCISNLCQSHGSDRLVALVKVLFRRRKSSDG